jgi:glycosyl transferase, family 25
MELRVLNLRRTPERWAAFRTHNPSLANAQQVEAVDGQALDLAALVAEGIVAADLNYRMGALGNALSHIAEWQRILHTGEPATIL